VGTYVGWERLFSLSVAQGSELLVTNVDDTITSANFRLEIWARAVTGIHDFALTGMGVGTFRQVIPVLYPFTGFWARIDVAHAHNHLLQAGLDLGVPGLAIYLALWLGTAGMLWQSWRRARSIWPKVLAAGFAASLVGYFVYGLTDTVALGAKPGFLFWMLLGLVTGLYLRVGNVELERERRLESNREQEEWSSKQTLIQDSNSDSGF
ncbi:MAG: O-antigen ligase family protein, partial [Chloroflexi bacterium]|nr:O-antigen ligase family protein [Chloroflexota bacterium]